MPYQIENMTKTEFDGFIDLLNSINFEAFPLEKATPNLKKIIGQMSIVNRLTADSDYSTVYQTFNDLWALRGFPANDAARVVRQGRLDNLREQCAN